MVGHGAPRRPHYSIGVTCGHDHEHQIRDKEVIPLWPLRDPFAIMSETPSPKVDMSKIENPDVARVFDSYPEAMRVKMMRLRKLVMDAASETEGVDGLEETLKWGEPSYLTRSGSTVRMDWKDRSPDRYAIYFNCNTPLIETFKRIYGDTFTFEGKRAIVFGETDELAVDELKHCVSTALTYHRVKHLPFLGM